MRHLPVTKSSANEDKLGWDCICCCQGCGRTKIISVLGGWRWHKGDFRLVATLLRFLPCRYGRAQAVAMQHPTVLQLEALPHP